MGKLVVGQRQIPEMCRPKPVSQPAQNVAVFQIWNHFRSDNDWYWLSLAGAGDVSAEQNDNDTEQNPADNRAMLWTCGHRQNGCPNGGGERGSSGSI